MNVLSVLEILTFLTGCILVQLEPSMANDFPIYWNMPAHTCAQHGYDYTSVKWKFIKNSNNAFQGEYISIFYNAGSFPRIDTDLKGKISSIRNGGVPQAGNMSFHLAELKKEINIVIPDQNNKGLAVIDMEDWYPRWKLNSGIKDIYRNFSRELVKNANPTYKTWEIEAEAVDSFHQYGEKFLIRTIRAAKRQRPKAIWGYYEFPYCDNYMLVNNKMQCSHDVRVENEKYLWIYDEMDALYPYIYLYQTYNETTRAKHIIGRLEETYRVLRARNITKLVYAYANPMLIESDNYLKKDDLLSSLLIPKVCGTDGVVIWGSSGWFSSPEKCAIFDEYLANIMGPAVNYAAECSIQEAKKWLQSKGERYEICK